MVTIGQAEITDSMEIEKLIAEYHFSERLTPIKERIEWAVDQHFRSVSPRPTPSGQGRGYDSGRGFDSLHAFS
jgi:hypothetical protein